MYAKILLCVAVLMPLTQAKYNTGNALDAEDLDRANVLNVDDLPMVSREEWHAKPPKEDGAKLNIPVPYVVIHHTYKPAACYTNDSCVEAMQWIQDLHQINNSWADIGYNFLVGGDNRVYVGRGWDTVGAHCKGFNNVSLGISIIGDWTSELPPQYQLQKVKDLISYGVGRGLIPKDYKLVGHKQVREGGGTECPGDRLFAEINTWPHFDPNPSRPNSNTAKDLFDD